LNLGKDSLVLPSESIKINDLDLVPEFLKIGGYIAKTLRCTVIPEMERGVIWTRPRRSEQKDPFGLFRGARIFPGNCPEVEQTHLFKPPVLTAYNFNKPIVIIG